MDSSRDFSNETGLHGEVPPTGKSGAMGQPLRNGPRPLRKGVISAILRCWVVYSARCKRMGLGGVVTSPKIKVLKGIPSVDDPFGACWSAQAAPLPHRSY